MDKVKLLHSHFTSVQRPASSMQLLCPQSSVQLLRPESQNSDMWCYYNVIGVCGICLGCVGFDVDSCFEFSCGNSCSVFGRGLWSIFKCCLSFVFCFLLVVMLLLICCGIFELRCVSNLHWLSVMFVFLLVIFFSSVWFYSSSCFCFVFVFRCIFLKGF